MKLVQHLAPLAAAFALMPGPDQANAQTPDRKVPNLTVIVVVDQLTAERTREWAQKPSSSGFRQLWRDGVVYANAAYDHATTATAPGHATLATGVAPAQHGVISNYWFEPEFGRAMASVRDANHSLLGTEGSGVSPLQMVEPTLADMLHEKWGGRSKIFTVSIKDRGAVFLAGKHGKAFWFSRDTGTFVTSTYYYPNGDLPRWLMDYNAHALDGLPRGWELLFPESTYRQPDEREWERPPRGWTRNFPHRFATADSSLYFDQLRYAPQGDQITAGLAKAIIAAESLGDDSHPDLLAISLSATDRIGHAFGHNSREAEDNLHRLDLLLADLLAFLEERLGNDGFLLVLSSDHGMSPIPETVAGADPRALRVLPFALARALNAELRRSFEVSRDLVVGIGAPWVYLNLEAIAQTNLNADQVAEQAAEWLEARPEIARAIIASQLDSCDQPELCTLIRNSSFPGRSGELYLVSGAAAFFSAEPPVYAASHGSPYLRDRSVPIIFHGFGLDAAVVDTPVTPRHVAPTLAALLGLPHLAAWEAPLTEVRTKRREQETQ
ncbi:alkaline phosphatase family protein [Candidatus Foliamicus sp.]